MGSAATWNGGNGSNASPRLPRDIYRARFGWPVQERTDGIFLLLAGGMAGVTMPPLPGRTVVLAMKHDDMCGPVIEYGGSQRRWLFLVETNDSATIAFHIEDLDGASGRTMRGLRYRDQLERTDAGVHTLRWMSELPGHVPPNLTSADERT